MVVSRFGRAFILGGNGFVGKTLLRYLRTMDVPVRALARNPPADEAGVEWVRGDLLDPSFDLSEHILDCSVLFNCVGELCDESRMYELHVDATVRSLSMCNKGRLPSLLHWVQLSSVGAYGPPRKASEIREVSEDTGLAPRGVYEVTKARADELVVAAGERGDITYSILRPSIIFGSGMRSESLRQLVASIRDRRFVYIGGSDAIAPYVHVDDVARALFLCGYRDEAKDQVFNISNDVLLSAFVVAVADHFSVSHPLLRVPEFAARVGCALLSPLPGFPLTQGRVNALVARTKYPSGKLRELLAFEPEKSLLSDFSEIFNV